MSNRCLALTALGVIAVVFVVERPLNGQGQSPRTTTTAKTSLRTPDGRPDLQGVWTFATLTPLERPANLAGKEILTEADAEKIVQQAADRAREESGPPRQAGSRDVGGFNQFWFENGTSVVADRRTSLIVDPPDGRIPALTDKGKALRVAHRAQLDRPPNDPEDGDASVRCILGFNAGPPMVGMGYNDYVQLVQTPKYVVIHTEMIHQARIVPLDVRSNTKEGLRPWLGDSRGRWEGDTLIVETRNFSDRVWNQFNRWNMGSDENLRVTERFSRPDADTLRYEFTVDDPTIWTRPWTAVIPMKKSSVPIYEYACHEGDYDLLTILKGARAEEAAAAGAAKK